MRRDDTEPRDGTGGPPRQGGRADPADDELTDHDLAGDELADDGLGGDGLGGDPACWLARVCPECGRLTEGRDPTRCAACGEPLS